MIGKKIYKKTDDMKNYSKVAIWCNANNAHIEDKGEYYEVVENVEFVPSVEEQKTQLIREYENNQEQLISYINKAMIYGEDVEELKNELFELDNNFDEMITNLEK